MADSYREMHISNVQSLTPKSQNDTLNCTLSDINIFIPSLYTFIADADWYLAAIKSMGYPDIVEEFERINREYLEYARNYHPDNQDNLEPLTQILESLIPSRYMDIIKNVGRLPLQKAY